MDREGRVAYCSAELLAVLRAQHAATRELEREKGIIVPRVFHRKGRRRDSNGRHSRGSITPLSSRVRRHDGLPF
jgi:hypothetical protein